MASGFATGTLMAQQPVLPVWPQSRRVVFSSYQRLHQPFLGAFLPGPSPLKTICGEGKSHVLSVPPFGMLDATRSVDSGLRCPGQGSWFGSSGMLFFGSNTSAPVIDASGLGFAWLLGSLMR